MGAQPRAFRFNIRSLMLAIVLLAIVCSALVERERARRAQQRYLDLIQSQTPPPALPQPYMPFAPVPRFRRLPPVQPVPRPQVPEGILPPPFRDRQDEPPARIILLGASR